jgi:hypothetical protein
MLTLSITTIDNGYAVKVKNDWIETLVQVAKQFGKI